MNERDAAKLVRTHDYDYLVKKYTSEKLPYLDSTLVLSHYGVDIEHFVKLIPYRYKSRDWLAHVAIVDGDIDFFDKIYKAYYSVKDIPVFLLEMTIVYEKIEILYYLLANKYILGLDNAFVISLKKEKIEMTSILSSCIDSETRFDKRELLQELASATQKHIEVLLSNTNFPFAISVHGITFAGILHYHKQYSLFTKVATHSLDSVFARIVYSSSREGLLVPELWGDIFYILLLLEGIILTERFPSLDSLLSALKGHATKLSD